MRKRKNQNTLQRKRTKHLVRKMALAMGFSSDEAQAMADNHVCAVKRKPFMFRNRDAKRTRRKVSAFIALVMAQHADITKSKKVAEFANAIGVMPSITKTDNRSSVLASLWENVIAVSGAFSSVAEMDAYLRNGGALYVENKQHGQLSWWVITMRSDALLVSLLYGSVGHDGTWGFIASPTTLISDDVVWHGDNDNVSLMVRPCGCPVEVRAFIGLFSEIGGGVKVAREIAKTIVKAHADANGLTPMRQQLAGHVLITAWSHREDVADTGGAMGGLWDIAGDASRGHHPII